jgi:hypothetical protein
MPQQKHCHIWLFIADGKGEDRLAQQTERRTRINPKGEKQFYCTKVPTEKGPIDGS